MNTDTVISVFSDFFVERGHRLIPGGSLIPPPGDSVLFTTSGMHPLTPYLEGKLHPCGQRLVGVQRCLRTTDLDEVGDDTHLTVFGMLGSWSLGDYEGPQSLRWGYELLTEGLGIDPQLLHVTVFGGDDHVGRDEDSLRTWRQLGLPVELTVEDNWWSNGPTGPCGPDSELFLWTGSGEPHGTPTTDDRWVEVWNHVMMQYRRRDDGSLEPLTQRNIDTGLGLERLLMVLQGKQSVYETDLFEPWMRLLPSLWNLSGEDLRVVTDHLRSSVIIVGDGIRPSNTGRGYVLRRLLRRTLTILWRSDGTRTLSDLPDELIVHSLGLFGQDGEVRQVFLDEEDRFRTLLERGRHILTRFPGPLSQQDFNYLHETHGLPRDLVENLISTNVGRSRLCRFVDTVTRE